MSWKKRKDALINEAEKNKALVEAEKSKVTDCIWKECWEISSIADFLALKAQLLLLLIALSSSA